MQLRFSYIIIIMIIAFNLCSQDYWIQHSSPTTKWLMTCVFTDTLNGWAAGDSGVIVHTSNAGQIWILQNSGIDYPISTIYFVNKNLGWGLANSYYYPGTAILKTTDGGNIWTHTNYQDTLTWLTAVYFLDSLTGFIAGQYGTILKTTDAGLSWTRCEVDTGAYSNRTIYKIKFNNPQHGIAAGGNMDNGGVVWKTSDSGLYWVSEYVSPEPVFDIILMDSLRTLGSGGDFDFGADVVKSFDNGVSWSFQTIQIFGIGYSLSLRTRNEIWVATGYGAYWGRSIDTGNVFHPVPIPDSAGIFGVEFIDSLHGWAVGNYGSIYKFNISAIGIKPISEKVPQEYRLFQNYPNPFNPSTIIKFDIPPEKSVSRQHVRLTIYDILGRVVSTPVNTDMRPGSYEITFDGSGYSSGVYFYMLEGEGFIQTRKLVLIK
jgi:photosystem II stability/assembly factor-like uncharacterized protein